LASELRALPETITVPRTDPIYNCHAYLTKVPVGAIRPFIETFTKPGDVVVDFFAGSGMTGLAALQTDRCAVLSDISVLGQHIARGYLAEVNASSLRKEAEGVMAKARKALGQLYEARRESDGALVEMVRTVWSFTYVCPACAKEMVYFDHVTPAGGPPSVCPHCDGAFARRSWVRGEDVPVEVVVDNPQGRQVTQDISLHDLKMVAEAQADPRQARVPSLTIGTDREMYSRSGLGKVGMTETAKFFSPRNAIALLELWNAIQAVEDLALRHKLSFAFTAILPRASRRYQWSAQRPLNAQNQTYYIAPIYYEWNVFELFGRKVEASVRADVELRGAKEATLFACKSGCEVTYELASANALTHLADASADYVFTDPPFGSNIYYSDMSLFHEAWLGTITNNEAEAVVHTTGSRKKDSAARYEDLLREAFAEGFRILKPSGHMSVVFGNSSGRIWGLVQRAIRDAGFKGAPVHVAILDKGQRSVKGLNSGSESVVTVDLIVTVAKPAEGQVVEEARVLSSSDTAALIRDAVAELTVEDAKNPSHVYARMLSRAIHQHLMLDELHLGDVLVALRQAGYSIDRKSGLLQRERTDRAA